MQKQQIPTILLNFFFQKPEIPLAEMQTTFFAARFQWGFRRVFLFAFNSSVFCIYEHVFAMPTVSHDFFAKLNTTE